MPLSGPPADGRPRPRSFRTTLTILMVGIIVVIAVIATVSSIALVRLVDARHALLNQVDPASLSTDQLLLAYVDQETGVRGYILGRNPAFLQPALSGEAAQRQSTQRLNAELQHNPALLGLALRAERQAQVWQKKWEQPAIKDTAAGNLSFSSPEALAYGKQLLDAARADFATLDRQLALQRTQDGNSVDSATVGLAIVVAAGILVMLAGIVALRIALHRWVSSPIDNVASDARAVIGGELSHPIAVAGPAEIAGLAVVMEEMRQRIVEELQEVDAARAELHARNEALRRSNLELEQFAYVASHDLQEPLRKVTSFVQLLQQRYGGQLDERADLYIEFAVDGATRMQRLITDLLAFSRVGHNTAGFRLQPMADCIAAALVNLEAAVEETSADVTVSDMPDVLGDTSLLVSLWQNLIGNSLKFRSSEPPRVAIDVERLDREWLFSITDNGIGIEPRFAQKIFVIFQRLHGRDSYPGTGIGLALGQKIVDFHGGRIWLDTSDRTGTRICFTLPMTDSRVRQ
jgi:signal transduction histidine kinase